MKELSDFKVGDHVVVSSVNDVDYSFLLGKSATVVKSDVPHKVKVEFDDQWCGYFLPDQLTIPASEPHIFMEKLVDACEKVGTLRCLIAVNKFVLNKFVLNGERSTDGAEEPALGSLYAQYDEAKKERDERLVAFWCNVSNLVKNK